MGQRHVQASEVGVGAETLWQWHVNPGAFERLQPPWERVEVVAWPERLEEGAEARFRVRAGGVWVEWVAQHRGVVAGKGFEDVQVRGPFAAWRHLHKMEAVEGGGSRLVDDVAYALPLGRLGALVAGRWVAGAIARMFRYRHGVMTGDLWRYGGARIGAGRVVVVTGHSGLIGRALVGLMRSLGFTVRGLGRRALRAGDGTWDWEQGAVDLEVLAGADAVVHLAGEPILGRWTAAKRRAIRESRVRGTAVLVEALGRLPRASRPQVMVSASGVNYYGVGAEDTREDGAVGDGFLARVCADWEAAARGVEALGMRWVGLRTGVVLTAGGGALAAMLPAFRAGMGGPLGGGKQRMSWIGLDDLLDLYVRAVVEADWTGAVNAVVPEPVRQVDFARALGRVLRRPTVMPGPRWALAGIYGGEMVAETLLGDMAVRPQRLMADVGMGGHRYRFTGLENCLAYSLGLRAKGYEG